MIRTYKPDDYDRVLTFIREYGDKHILGMPERRSDVRAGFIYEGFASHGYRRNGCTYRILGYTAMSLDQKYSITVVRRGCRKAGIGSQLLKAKIKWAKVHGLQYLETKVGVTNHASIGMLNKFGYIVAGLGTATTGKPVLTMRLTL